MKLAIVVLCLLLALAYSQSALTPAQDVSGDWCFNMDYLFRLQHTIDRVTVKKIVEVSPRKSTFTEILFLTSKQFVKYQFNPWAEDEPDQIATISKLQEQGDLLLLEDVLMYLPNEQINRVVEKVIPRFRFVLILISATAKPQQDTTVGVYRPLNMQFPKGRKVVSMELKEVRKEVWLIDNQQ